MELQLTSFETSIENFLNNLSNEDESFAKKYAKPNKSISECCKYIYQQVEKNRKDNARCVGCSSDEIFGLAIHYYDEDDIKVDGPKVPVKEVQQISSSPTSTKQPKESKKRAKSKEKVVDPDIPELLEIPLF